MSHHHPRVAHVGRAGWFAIGALAASMAFVAMLVAGDLLRAMSSEKAEETRPSLVIEGN